MIAIDVVCPICGVRLVLERSLPTAAGDGITRIGQCENQHWWFQSAVFGWIPIDPGTTPVGEAITDPAARGIQGLVSPAGRLGSEQSEGASLVMQRWLEIERSLDGAEARLEALAPQTPLTEPQVQELHEIRHLLTALASDLLGEGHPLVPAITTAAAH